MNTMSGNRRRTSIFVLAIVILALTVLAASGVVGAAGHGTTQAAQTVVSDNPSQTSLETSGVYTQLYQEISPSVVAIRVTVVGRNNRIVGSATGSGFVIDSEGHIVTNNHVVQQANFIEIEFYDGTLAEGTVVGLDPDSDLAVLDVNLPTEQFQPVSFGNSDALVVGEPVIALGSPFGQDWTLTTGIVSGLNRIIEGLSNYSIGGIIQTDAAINPGNSGGPLLNLDGQVIGVNSQIASSSGSGSGVGFAVPSNLVQRVALELIADGSVDYSYIGIAGADVNLSMIQALDLPADTRGVAVSQVTSGGPAAQAGVRGSDFTRVSNGGVSNVDIITAIDGVQVKGMDELVSYLARYTLPGQTVAVSVLRDGREPIALNVTLSPRP
ncbi:MAG: trypsin-like peptidase domain-containing protein [Anaerolineae bacterium]|nr:trypsin-like peptidase domain-containing protein [Anaerolineae bacterium]